MSEATLQHFTNSESSEIFVSVNGATKKVKLNLAVSFVLNSLT